MSFSCVILVANIPNYLYQLSQKVKSYIQNFNLFPSIPPSIDEHQLQNERISTRIFLFLLTLSLAILLLYNSLVIVTETVNIKTPTIAEYSQLYSTYSQTLTCPCTQISINYDVFLNVEYTFHQVCDSLFITKDWINYLSASSYNLEIYLEDFRATSPFIFQTLSAFCGLVNETISNSLTQFYSGQYVSASVIPSQVFEAQAESLISEFISSTTNDFLFSLSIIRDTTQSNALFCAQLTNFDLYTPGGSGIAEVSPESYGNCICSLSAECIGQSSVLKYPSGKVSFSVPGIYLGCYIIEALLQSDLRCFYNQTCVNRVVYYFKAVPPMNVTALDESLPSRFSPNSTLQGVINQLMVEQWNRSTMYDQYYNECQPTKCTHTRQTKNSIIFIVTTLIGLLGGLITVLKLIVPRVVMFVRKKQEL